MKKSISKLAKKDFEEFPIWEMVDILQMEPYTGATPIKPAKLSAFFVRANVVLADNTKFIGMSIVGKDDDDKMTVSSPTIFTDEGQVNFGRSLQGSEQKELDEAARKLGRPFSKIFPVSFETDAPIEGGPLKGEVAGFDTTYRYKDEDRQPHQVTLVFKSESELNAAIKEIKSKESPEKKALQPSKAEKAFLKAAENGDVAEIKTLLSKDVNVNRGGRFEFGRYIEKGVTALMLAAQKGNLEIVRVLLDAGAAIDQPAESSQPGQNGRTALACACRYGQIEAARLLLKAGANPNHKLGSGKSILDDTCEGKSGKELQELLAGGANADVLSGPKNLDLIRLLLTSGANSDGSLVSAVEANRLDVFKLLIEHNADVNAIALWDETPLMKASNRLHAEMVHLLLDAGADVNLKSHRNASTALHEAVEKVWLLDLGSPAAAETFPKAMAIIKALIAKGADVNAPNNRGQTPLSLAKDCKFPELAAFLESHK